MLDLGTAWNKDSVDSFEGLFVDRWGLALSNTLSRLIYLVFFGVVTKVG